MDRTNLLGYALQVGCCNVLMLLTKRKWVTVFACVALKIGLVSGGSEQSYKQVGSCNIDHV